MKKNDAFTLIELLGIIFIIGILSAIATASFISYANKAKSKSFKIEETNFIDAVKTAYTDCLSGNINSDFCTNHKYLDTENEHDIIYLHELINDDYINKIKNPYDTNKFCDEQRSYVYAIRKNSYQENNSNILYEVCLICGNYESENCFK